MTDTTAELQKALGGEWRVKIGLVDYEAHTLYIYRASDPFGGYKFFIKDMQQVMDPKTGLTRYETVTNSA